MNKNSWSLMCDKHSYSVHHNKNLTDLPALPPYHRAGVCDDGAGAGVCVYRVGVCVDHPAGTLSFYSVSDSDTLTLLHTFHTHFTQHTPPLCWVWSVGGLSVPLPTGVETHTHTHTHTLWHPTGEREAERAGISVSKIIF
ncbi:hypothetical protein COCON_G00232970 [Conger conger]|uniref:B30.2/SPRY domain-containing protein n=1 Tax=Conger conger TaxID=82655 RepID=A0A9Q1HN97_CONCO|nr:hypothetical protein COCON_G00232970 [Conger conger]